jgi:hypothetical protein
VSEIELRPDPAELSVAIGFPTGPMLPWPTALSLARTTHACAKRGIDVSIEYVAGSSIITTARSLVVSRFLASGKKRLFWIDSDIEWEPEDFLRLLAMSTELDVVCGAYPLKREDGGNSFVVLHEDSTKITMNRFGCLKIQGTGLGFCVMRRELVERLVATKPPVFNQGTSEMMADVFRIDSIPENLLPGARQVLRGEDMAFFDDLRDLGAEVWLDPTVPLGHVGYKVFRGDLVKAFGLGHVFEKVPA